MHVTSTQLITMRARGSERDTRVANETIIIIIVVMGHKKPLDGRVPRLDNIPISLSQIIALNRFV